LISGTTSGTAGSIRNALDLSTTTAPAFTAWGAYSFDCAEPAEKKDSTKVDSTAIKKTKKQPAPKDEGPKSKVASTDSLKTAVPSDTLKKKEEIKDKDLGKFYVLNSKGDTIRYINQKLEEKWNDVYWDLREKGVRFPSRNEPPPDADDPSGQYVLPGQYKIVALYNKLKDSTMITVGLDPRLNITPADLEARNNMAKAFSADVDLSQRAFKALQDVRKDLKMFESLLVNAPDSIKDKFKDQQKDLTKKMVAIETKFMEPEDVKGFTDEINLGTYLYSSSSYLSSSLGDPGSNARDMLKLTHAEVEKLVKEVNDFLEKDWVEFKAKVDLSQWPLFKKIDPLK